MSTVLIAFAAAFAMLCTDSIGTMLVMAQARGRGRLAGLLDSVGWLFAISTTFLTVDTLAGHDMVRKIAVVLAVTVANYFGTELGEWLGTKYVKDRTIEARLLALEANAKP